MKGRPVQGGFFDDGPFRIQFQSPVRVRRGKKPDSGDYLEIPVEVGDSTV